MRLIALKNMRRTALLGASLLVLGLAAGCADDTDTVPGSPFTQALNKDYSDLATQEASTPSPDSDDDDDFLGLGSLFGGSDSATDLLAKAFSDKAEIAANGQEPAPEAAPGDPMAQGIRGRLVRALASGKDQFPEQAARAQTDYDCWVLNGTVPSQAAAAQACKSALDRSLVALEWAARPVPPPAPVYTAPPAPAYTAPAPAAAAPSAFTVYFDFDSWTLTAEDLTVLTNVINTARAGGQSRIAIVGHTDTSGSDAYNQRLSVRRANVAVEALVDMGARRAAIQASGVGETDLAVQTGDGIKEAKNRRDVISLQP